jgi:hypothetical protein
VSLGAGALEAGDTLGEALLNILKHRDVYQQKRPIFTVLPISLGKIPGHISYSTLADAM